MLTKLAKLREEREQGFTLIELLVVILIIGILAAIAIPAFMKQRQSAVDSSVESDLKNTATTIETAAMKSRGATVPVSGDTSAGVPLMVGSEDITAEALKSSDATNLKLEGTTDDYTITGTNEGGDEASSGIVYSSAQGGLVKGSAPAGLGGGSNQANDAEIVASTNFTIWTAQMDSYPASATFTRGGVLTITSNASLNKSFKLDNSYLLGSEDITFTGQGATFVNGKASWNVGQKAPDRIDRFQVQIDRY